MKSPFDTGLNRTGISASPIDAPKQVASAEEGGSSSPGDATLISAERNLYAQEADPMGQMPPPSTLKGAVKTAVTALKGEKANVFIDKLAERLAFERAGYRLYDAATAKAQVYASWANGPTEVDLAEIRDEELAHVGLVTECLRELGADPTAMTPSANLAVNLSKGLPLVLTDPRTDLRECLEGLLIAELSDNACWESLVILARELNQESMAVRFEHALRREERHLQRVRTWLRSGILAALEREEAPRPAEMTSPAAP
jgi:hypothetical protein